MTTASVIMPAFNAARFIDAAIASVLGQTHADLELIVIDDGSTDVTRSIVERAAGSDDRVRLLQRPHAGVSSARNAGLAAARGALVTFLDADDLWPADRLARQVRRLAESPDRSLVAGRIVVFGEDDAPDLHASSGNAQALLSINLGAATMRRALFDELGDFDRELVYFEDLDLFLRAYDAGIDILTEAEVSLFHRRHGSNMSRDAAAGRPFMLKALHRSMLRRRRIGAQTGGRPFPLLMPSDLAAAARQTVEETSAAAAREDRR